VEGDVHRLTSNDVGGILNGGGTMLFSARYPEFNEKKGQLKGVEQLKKHGIEGVVVMGEDGSIRGAQSLSNHGFQSILPALDISLRISAWEHRWVLENMAEQHPTQLGKYLISHIENARQISLKQYRADLNAREHARRQMKALAPMYDGFISLS